MKKDLMNMQKLLEKEKKIPIQIPYTPEPKQLIAHESEAKFVAVITGVGFGKTTWGVNAIIRDAINSKAGAVYLLFAPTTPMLKNVLLTEFIKWCPTEIITEHHKTDHRFTLINGVTILYLSGDIERSIDRLRGLNLSGFYVDELRLTQKYVWDVLVGRLRNSNGTLKGRAGTTPAGFDWIYDLFVRKAKVKNPQDYEVFTGSSLENPHTPQEFKDSLLATYDDDQAKQEIYGGFVSSRGLVYPTFNEDTHVGDFREKEFSYYIAEVDWGFTNEAVLLVNGVDSDDRMYVVKEIYERGLFFDDFVNMAKEVKKDYNPRYFVADPSEPEHIKKFNIEGLRTNKANNEIIAGISEVKTRLKIQKDGQPRLFVDKKCINTIREFNSYRYPESKEEKEPDEKPLKLNDHTQDCIRYGVMSLGRRRTSTSLY